MAGFLYRLRALPYDLAIRLSSRVKGRNNMLDFRDDYKEMIRREIHKAANSVRHEERPKWKRVEPWHVCFLSDKHGSHKWCTIFLMLMGTGMESHLNAHPMPTPSGLGKKSYNNLGTTNLN